MQLRYKFLIGTPVTGIVEKSQVSSATVSEWCGFIPQLLSESVSQEDTKIEGPNIKIEIYNTKLSKKYNKGHCVEGVWVPAVIEKTSVKKSLLLKLN